MRLKLRPRLAATEAWLALAAAWLLVFALPFRRTVAWLGTPKSPRDAAPASPERRERARHVCRRIARLAPRAPWRTTCLVQAVAGLLLLKRRGIAATIRLGVGKNGGALTAHAWLIVGDETLLGGGAAPDFAPLADMGGRAA